MIDILEQTETSLREALSSLEVVLREPDGPCVREHVDLARDRITSVIRGLRDLDALTRSIAMTHARASANVPRCGQTPTGACLVGVKK